MPLFEFGLAQPLAAIAIRLAAIKVRRMRVSIGWSFGDQTMTVKFMGRVVLGRREPRADRGMDIRQLAAR